MPVGQELPTRGKGFWAVEVRDRVRIAMNTLDLNMAVRLCIDGMAIWGKGAAEVADAEDGSTVIQENGLMGIV